PLLTARVLCRQMGGMALVAIEGTLGLWLSVKTDAPPGATIACVSGGAFALLAAARARAPVLPRGAPAAAAPLAALALLAAGCGQPGPAAGQLEVVAATTPRRERARAGGGRGVFLH